MIYVKSGNNSVVVQLGDKATNPINPYWTWKLTDKDSMETTIFTADDWSPVPHIWNGFTISVATYSGLTSGIINLPAQEYSFQIYEMSNPYDLDINNAVGLAYSGLLVVEGTFSTPVSYTQSNATPHVVYRNQDRL